MAGRPHISAALRQLRRGVNICAGAVALACVAQLLVFGFVHFTDIRFENLQAGVSNQPLIVQASAGDVPAALVDLEAEARAHAEAAAAATPIDVNRVQSTAGVILEQISQMAAVLGVFGALSLAAFTLLGAIVAGGAAVPGVEKAVSACTWGLVLGMMTLPWQDIFGSMPFAGVFTSYDTMVSASDSSRLANFSLVLVFIGIPIVAVVGTAIVALNFSSGVERGIVASDNRDDVDKDMDATLTAMGSTRQIGAVRNDFRKTVGAPTVVAEPATERPTVNQPRREPPAAAAPPPTGRKRRAVLNPEEEDEWKRPI